MAHLFRLILAALFCVLGVVAYAACVEPGGYADDQEYSRGPTGPWFPDWASVCAQVIPSGATGVVEGWPQYAHLYHCQYVMQSPPYAPGTIHSVQIYRRPQAAPPPPYCQPDPCEGNDVLLSASFGTVLLAKGQTSACFNGCQVNFKSGYEGPDFYAAGTDGVLRGHVPVGQLQATNTTGSCAPDATDPLPEADPKTAAELPCPIGKIPGTASMNGVTVTVCSDPIKTETTGIKTVSEQTPDGSKVTSESKTTQCQDGKCTSTTTTTVTQNGTSTTSTRTTQQGQGEFCAENPTDKACKGSGFGGTCQQGFTCDGDAISCATAKAVNDQYCSFKEAFDVGDDAKSLANRVMGGTEVADPKANATVIDVGVFDQSNPLSSTCPGDVPIQLSGFTMVLPLASGCSWFQLIGNMMVLVSLFGATVFVLRGV